MYFWVTWKQPTKDYRPSKPFQTNENILGWWCIEEPAGEEPAILAALVKANNSRLAKMSILHEWCDLGDWISIQTRDDIDIGDKYPLDGWMTVRFEQEKAKNVVLQVPKYKALELDTAECVEGYYYMENGYWTSNGVPDLNKPVQRHKIVDVNGLHREVAPETLEAVA